MNHLGWACEGGVRMYLFKLNNSRALRGSLCGWFRDISVPDSGTHLPAPAAPTPLLGTRLLDQAMKHTEETTDIPEGPQVDSRVGVQSCLGVLEGPAGSLFAWWLQLFSIAVIKTIASLGAQKPLEFISSQFCVSEVWVSWAGFSNPGLTKPRSECWLARTLLWRWWGRLCSQPHPVLSFAAAPLSSCSLLGVVGDLRQPGKTPYFPHCIASSVFTASNNTATAHASISSAASASVLSPLEKVLCFLRLTRLEPGPPN